MNANSRPPTSLPLLIGLGDAGKNVLMDSLDLCNGLPLLFINSDQASLRDIRDYPILQIGQRLLQGGGAGRGNPLGGQAVEESLWEILQAIGGHDRVVVFAALMGGIGGTAPLLASELSKYGITTLLELSTPFPFETGRSAVERIAAELRQNPSQAGSVTLHDPDRILRAADPELNITMENAIRLLNRHMMTDLLGRLR